MGKSAAQAQVDTVSRRYQALLGLTESISAHSNIPELFKQLPGLLRPVVNFDAVAVALHDAEHDIMRLHIFQSSIPIANEPLKGEGGPASLSPEGIAWQTQKPVLISAVTSETRFPEYTARLRAENINTLYSIPLTSSGRRLGAIAFGTTRENAYEEADLEFLRQVAKQVAVAIDNVLNFQTAAGERDRKQLLLEINNAVASDLDLRELIGTISKRLQDVIAHDGMGLAVWDEEIKQLRMHAVHTRSPVPVAEGTPIPLEGTPAGITFTTRQTIIRNRVDFDEFDYPPFRQMVQVLGLMSGCTVPLILEDRVIGERWDEAGAPNLAELKRHLQSEGYSVFQWTDAAGTKYGPHAHAEDQSHWIVSGQLELRVGHETYTLQAGDRDFLPANTIHSAVVPGDEPVTYLIGAKH